MSDQRETPMEFITGVLLACVVGWVFKIALVGWWT
jgi:hypothetical protein